MLILGLAVPVTASFIIAAAVVAPALVSLGVEDFAAYMFIFYYAVLSEVSPPTALSAFAAPAITGGNGFKTMMLTCRYTLPAFLVPFAFILSPKGEGLLQGGLGRSRSPSLSRLGARRHRARLARVVIGIAAAACGELEVTEIGRPSWGGLAQGGAWPARGWIMGCAALLLGS